jgi:hypothetical protein
MDPSGLRPDPGELPFAEDASPLLTDEEVRAYLRRHGSVDPGWSAPVVYETWPPPEADSMRMTGPEYEAAFRRYRDARNAEMFAECAVSRRGHGGDLPKLFLRVLLGLSVAWMTWSFYAALSAELPRLGSWPLWVDRHGLMFPLGAVMLSAYLLKARVAGWRAATASAGGVVWGFFALSLRLALSVMLLAFALIGLSRGPRYYRW